MKPILPPRRGYVEVLVGGKHLYKNVKTGAFVKPNETDDTSDDMQLEEMRSKLKLSDAQVAALSDRSDFLEELIVEMAMIVYA